MSNNRSTEVNVKHAAWQWTLLIVAVIAGAFVYTNFKDDGYTISRGVPPAATVTETVEVPMIVETTVVERITIQVPLPQMVSPTASPTTRGEDKWKAPASPSPTFSPRPEDKWKAPTVASTTPLIFISPTSKSIWSK